MKCKNSGVKTFEGTIGDETEVKLIIRGRNGDAPHLINLAGYGVYKRINKPFAISGIIDLRKEKKIFWIKEFNGKGLERTATFEGRFTSNGKVEGFWVSTHGSTPFSLTEKTNGNVTQLSAAIDDVQRKFEALKKRLPN